MYETTIMFMINKYIFSYYLKALICLINIQNLKLLLQEKDYLETNF